MEPRSCPLGWFPKHDGKHPRLWAWKSPVWGWKWPYFSWWLANGFRETLFSNKIKKGNCVRLCTSPCHFKILMLICLGLLFLHKPFTSESGLRRIPGFNGGTHGSSPRSNGSSPRCSQGAPKAAGVPWTVFFRVFFFLRKFTKKIWLYSYPWYSHNWWQPDKNRNDV